jgi:DNA-binding IclR family transcriptional regulator
MVQKPKDYATVQRALELLNCFTRSNQELGLQELSTLIGFHKSAVSRIMKVLEYYGYVQRNPSTKKYSLGKTIADLGMVATHSVSSNLLAIARPHIDHLRDQVREDVAFEVLMGNHTVFLYIAETSQPLRIGFRAGVSPPRHVAAGSKAILAFADRDTRDLLLKPRTTFKRYTTNTITKRSLLLKELEQVKSEGVAYDRGEYHDDVFAVAAPVLKHDNQPIAAVTIGVPSTRTESTFNAEVIGLLKTTANLISGKLFYSDD